MPKKPKKALVRYSFKPPKPATLLRNRVELTKARRERGLMKGLVQGKTYEALSDEYGMSVKDVYDWAKRTVAKWVNDTCLTALEARELEIKQLKALQVICWREVEPQPMFDADGGKIIDARTGAQAMSRPDPDYIKLLLAISDRVAMYLGLRAEKGMEIAAEDKSIRREYVGVNPDNL